MKLISIPIRSIKIYDDYILHSPASMVRFCTAQRKNNFSQSYADRTPADFRRAFSSVFLRYSERLWENFLEPSPGVSWLENQNNYLNLNHQFKTMEYSWVLEYKIKINRSGLCLISG